MRRVSIIQGEIHVATEPDILIGTLLGSCIAICLYDAAARIGGMNHFLLAKPTAHACIRDTDRRRYGNHATEHVIDEMVRKGAARTRLRAHMYGGADILAGFGASGSRNAAFAGRFIAAQGFEVGRTGLGGTAARRIEFLPHLGKVRSWTVADPFSHGATAAP